MPSKYFQNYGQPAIEINLVEDLYNEAIFMQGFSGYYIPNTNSEARDLIYGDDPLKAFTVAYKLDMYLVNTMDYGDEQDFFTKFGLEVRNQTKIQFTFKEFNKQTKKIYDRPIEGDLIFIPFIKNSGELFEIKFVNTSKDLYTLGRVRPFYYELSLEPFKYNDENIDTGVEEIDIIETLEAYKTTIDVYNGSGNFTVGEIVYQGDENSHIASAEVASWDAANTSLTIYDISGEFSNTSNLLIKGNSSGATYSLTTVDTLTLGSQFDNVPILKEVVDFVDKTKDNPFASLTYY
jgi:hypothetical protein